MGPGAGPGAAGPSPAALGAAGGPGAGAPPGRGAGACPCRGAGTAQAAGEALPPLRLLVLQPAIPTREKFRVTQQQRLLDLLAMAQREAGQRRADALLLPEGALPPEKPCRSRPVRWCWAGASATPASSCAAACCAFPGRVAARALGRQAPPGAPGGVGAVR
ncbi:hypothetical protein [Cyanobium sp. ATX-6F1]|uniref:hypothetical protein n=1 Tax=Cyanobium sp. ATX-6F1 TaxID=3137388 RepID=UPI0039BEB41E